jgi:hypothetical protein
MTVWVNVEPQSSLSTGVFQVPSSNSSSRRQLPVQVQQTCTVAMTQRIHRSATVPLPHSRPARVLCWDASVRPTQPAPLPLRPPGVWDRWALLPCAGSFSRKFEDKGEHSGICQYCQDISKTLKSKYIHAPPCNAHNSGACFTGY